MMNVNVKEEIQILENLENKITEAEKRLGKHIVSRLKYLYKLQEDYRKNYPQFIPLIDWEDIEIEIDDIQILEDSLMINYYNTYTYNGGEIIIPIDALEDDSGIEKWFGIKTSEFENRLEKAKKEKEAKEYNEFLRLKEKYECNRNQDPT